MSIIIISKKAKYINYLIDNKITKWTQDLITMNSEDLASIIPPSNNHFIQLILKFV